VLDGEERVDLIMTVSLPSNNIKNDLENSSSHEKTKVLMVKFSRPSNYTITNLVMKVLSLVNQKLNLFPPVQDLH
jgi:hypothetical protein